MIKGQSQINHRSDRDGIVDDDRALGDGSDAKNRDLRLIDNGGSQKAPKHSRISDGEGPILYVFRSQALFACAFRQVNRGSGQAQKAFLISVLDHRDRKSTRLNSSHITISYAVFCLKK